MMLTFETLLIFIPTVALLVILPGPDFAIVTKISIFDGKKPAQAAAIGITLGICIHTMLAMLGLSTIVSRSAVLFSMLKYVGAIYLFYIGVLEFKKSIKLKNWQNQSETKKNEAEDHNVTSYFYTGFLTNLLNPKAILYFMVLYPQFIDQSTPLTMQFLEMGIITALICLCWYMMLASIFIKIRIFFTSVKCQRWLMRFTGTIFICFGLKLAAQKLE